MGKQLLIVGLACVVLGACSGTQAASTAPSTGPATATPPPVATTPKIDPSAWRQVIDGQIGAFRVADAGKALSYAGAPFQAKFKDPMAFMTAIAGAGYAPIFTSISDSFGKYEQPDDKTVLQEVDFVGGDQKLFVAIYALSLEAGGWRVEGVQLAQTSGMGI